MPTTETTVLLAVTAAGIGFLHTLLGPDHYLPFIMMARAGNWSRLKTYVVAGLCGVGHVGSSIVIGAIGIGSRRPLSKGSALCYVRRRMDTRSRSCSSLPSFSRGRMKAT